MPFVELLCDRFAGITHAATQPVRVFLATLLQLQYHDQRKTWAMTPATMTMKNLSVATQYTSQPSKATLASEPGTLELRNRDHCTPLQCAILLTN